MQGELFERINAWVKKRKWLNEYLHKWLWYVKKSNQGKKFHGCLFVSFSCQLSTEDVQIFASKMEEIGSQWIQLLASFISDLQKQGKIRAKINPKEIAPRYAQYLPGKCYSLEAHLEPASI